ncbi:MAG TPA: hypothetical protein VF493_15060, partial [Terriglobales bacterium]
SALALARVAELQLSLGWTREAEKTAKQAVAASPSESRAHMILGFVHLAQINVKEAKEDFERASELDSTEPLSRLGLGLAIIREGKLVEGREQIEIAVALDPANSLLRSYMGKAYYEENTMERDALASTQFGLAKQLDPNDPTPWFYDGILKDSQTRPAEALHELERSVQQNDNNAVFRSRLLLDQDQAARSTTRGSIYNELGFSRLGLVEATSSLAIDPGSAETHRFLADIDAALPRQGIARASELLQAQLRQPLGAPPLQPQLANDVLFSNSLFGPATVGMHEFNPLFIQDKLGLQIFGLIESDNTLGDQIILQGLRGPLSFAFSQFRAYTDGYRVNNDSDNQQYDAFFQVQPTTSTSVQYEFTRTRSSFGDLEPRFDPAGFDPLQRNTDNTDTHRFGLRQVLDPRSDLLVSLIRQQSDASFDSKDPVLPATIAVNQESWKTEAQYLTRPGALAVIAGLSYFEGTSDETITVGPFPPDISHFAPRHENGYAYLYAPTFRGFPKLQLGLSYDHLKSDVGDQTSVNPKVGLTWPATESITFRAAGYRVLKRRLASDHGLEPTQVAGFNQLFDDTNGTISDSYGIGGDFVLMPNLSTGMQYTYRSLKVPYFDVAQNVFFQTQTEKTISGYLYWLPTIHLSITLQPQYQHFNQGAVFDELDLFEVPLAFRLFLPDGIWLGASVTSVAEHVKVGGTSDSDRFSLLDAVIAYRLPHRMGTVSLQGTNLTNQKFKFQEIDPTVLPRYAPETRVLLRFSLNF